MEAFNVFVAIPILMQVPAENAALDVLRRIVKRLGIGEYLDKDRMISLLKEFL